MASGLTTLGYGILLFILTYDGSADGYGKIGYFNETSRVLLHMTWNIRTDIGFSFRTCSDGELLYQIGANGDILKLNLSQGFLQFYWKVGLVESTISTGSDLTNNKWYNIDLIFYLGRVWLNISQGPNLYSSMLIANSTFHASLWNVNLQGNIGLVLGSGFTGCLMQGPNIIFLGQRNIDVTNVIWTNSSCPIADASCSEGK